MDTRSLKAVVAGMNEALALSEHILGKIYNLDMDVALFHSEDDRSGERTMLICSLKASLEAAAEQMSVYLELCGLKETRSDFLFKWKQLGPNLAEVTLNHTEDEDEQSCPGYDYLSRLYWTFRQMLPEGPKQGVPEQDYALRDQLLYVLRSTPQILRNYGITPKCEEDIKETMNKHLRTVFKDYTSNPMIAKPIVNFKPDGGVRSLRSAVEFKFCQSETDIKTAIHGLTEDRSGYSGSKDWTNFYSVIFQTEPFINETEGGEALTSANNWKFMVVTGGNPKTRIRAVRARRTRRK